MFRIMFKIVKRETLIHILTHMCYIYNIISFIFLFFFKKKKENSLRDIDIACNKFSGTVSVKINAIF